MNKIRFTCARGDIDVPEGLGVAILDLAGINRTKANEITGDAVEKVIDVIGECLESLEEAMQWGCGSFRFKTIRADYNVLGSTVQVKESADRPGTQEAWIGEEGGFLGYLWEKDGTWEASSGDKIATSLPSMQAALEFLVEHKND